MMKIFSKIKKCLSLLTLLVVGCPISAWAAINCSLGNMELNNVSLIEEGGAIAGTIDNPWINQRHIFCGEVRIVSGNLVAKGFHSQPLAERPITNDGDLHINYVDIFNTNPVLPGADQLYTSINVRVLNGENYIPKNGNSTMFPNQCTQEQVINSIRYAFNIAVDLGDLPNDRNVFNQKSGPGGGNYCYANGAPFTIRGYRNQIEGAYIINTAFPILN
ncbi:EndoU domain-containing protein [Pseudoalteromonas luteoviolacea]|uniref:EndoU domain-containing protein n=1 Tax=Pseudoalteromonas luteoviolacea TaxID=43657 RepID=UPI001B3906C2|nr:EndoU domain-containing protein [Pseudoalteromonas luteoviolacea]MBQ4835444.1 EndoU domain-containing protein [Pseudoalteromonas luteoviolacea]